MNRRLNLVNLEDVTPEKVEWIWRQRIPRRKLIVLDGDPGVGKSTITLDIAARVSVGMPFPEEADTRPPGGVVIASAEDGIADTIQPRLRAAGADLARVKAIKSVFCSNGEEDAFTLPEDINMLKEAIDEVDAHLVIIDPLTAILCGSVDAHRDQDVRRVLHALSNVATESGSAILLVRHLNKTTGAKVIYRGGGSIGIIGAARVGLLAARNPQDQGGSVLAVTKSNVGAKPASLLYKIENDDNVGASRISWCGPTDIDERILLQDLPSSPSTALGEGKEFLKRILANGRLAQVRVAKLAEEEGISEKTLFRAKKDLGVESIKIGGPGEESHWEWKLPEDGQEEPKVAHKNAWPSSANDGHLQASGQTEREVFDF